MDHMGERERKGPPMTTDESTDEQTVPDDETTDERDQQEQSRRLSEDRDDPDAGPEGDDDEDQDDEDDEDDDGDTFPRHYVERLRSRSAGYRARAKTAEGRVTELEQALYTERVRALDVLADPTDLPYDPDALDDPDALRAAVDELVSKRPHLRRRGVARDTGSREQHEGGDSVSLLGLMRGGA